MNFFHIINKLAEVDADALGRLDSRRAIFSSLTKVTKRTAMASAPALLASFFQKAYAGTTAGDPKEIFNYALSLELLEADFYRQLQLAPAFIADAPAAAKTAIQQIKKHEDAHVALLQKVVTGIGGTPVTGITFKTTSMPATYAGQLVVAQLLEDTGVRAYKGRAGDLQGLADATIPMVGTINPLQAALQIHSVEARHAAHIRTMRGQTPWISGNGDQDGHVAYAGATPESTTTQSGVSLIGANAITAATTYTAVDAAASFDEPLTVAEVVAIARTLGNGF